MLNAIDKWTIASIVLTLIGAWCVGRAVIHPFKGAEYGGISADNFDKKVHQTGEYAAWDKKNTAWTRAGIALITIGGLIQIVCVFVSARAVTWQGASPERTHPARALARAGRGCSTRSRVVWCVIRSTSHRGAAKRGVNQRSGTGPLRQSPNAMLPIAPQSER